MAFDDLLLAMIFGGFGLSVTYLKAELELHRRSRAADRSKALILWKLHAARNRPVRNSMPVFTCRSATELRADVRYPPPASPSISALMSRNFSDGNLNVTTWPMPIMTYHEITSTPCGGKFLYHPSK
jgi:hypothetical protein